MNQSILTSLDIFLLRYGYDRIFYIFASIKGVIFTLNLCLSLCVYYYSIKKRLWSLFLLFSMDVFLVGLYSFAGGGALYIALTLSLSPIAVAPQFIIRERVRVVGEKELQLARLLSEKVREGGSAHQVEQEQTIPIKQVQPQVTGKPQGEDRYGLDFSHVKKVLARLEYFPLSQADKRQVDELNSLIYSAENGAFSEQIKEKINEGLGALLKIMSKHGA